MTVTFVVVSPDVMQARNTRVVGIDAYAKHAPSFQSERTKHKLGIWFGKTGLLVLASALANHLKPKDEETLIWLIIALRHKNVTTY